MIRHSARTQAIADKFNEECRCFDYTVYRGHYDGWLVYQPVHADSQVYIEGFPTLILVSEDDVVEATIDSPWNPFDVLRYCDKHYDYLRPGRKILREYRRKFDENDFCSDEEREYISEIVIGTFYAPYDTPLNYADVCVYLEIAHRVGKRLAIKPIEETMDRCDGWAYYVEVV